MNLSFDELNQLLIRPGGHALVIANEAANITNANIITTSQQTNNHHSNNSKQ